jgi:hypothetical protein
LSRLTDYEGCGPLRVIREFTDFDGQSLRPGQLLAFDFYSRVPLEAGFTFSRNGESVLRLSAEVPADAQILDHPENYFQLPLPRLAWYTNGPALAVTHPFTDRHGRSFLPGDQLNWAVHERDQTQLLHSFLGHAGEVLQLDEQNEQHAAVLLYPERFFDLPFDARPL